MDNFLSRALSRLSAAARSAGSEVELSVELPVGWTVETQVGGPSGPWVRDTIVEDETGLILVRFCTSKEEAEEAAQQWERPSSTRLVRWARVGEEPITLRQDRT